MTKRTMTKRTITKRTRRKRTRRKRTLRKMMNQWVRVLRKESGSVQENAEEEDSAQNDEPVG